MQMKFHAECAACLVEANLRKAAPVQDQALRAEYMRRICEIIAGADMENEAPPLVDARIIRLRRDLLGIEDDFTAIKHSFNQLLLGLCDKLRARIDGAEDPLYAALQLSMAGNYIDFGVLKDVDPDELLRLLDDAAEKHVDPDEYKQLRDDLARPGGELVFIHDNCGEIVLDRLLIETIKQLYPQQEIVSLVRGTPVLNDATLEDAVEAGLPEVAELMENGLEYVAGTDLKCVPEAVQERIQNAKLVIAKGQGNFETLAGCGLNVYYLFLSKCAGYTQWYGFERFSGVLANDRRMRFGK
ncbi:MAG: ARMT1-like domain-containing protein [Clostridia bacterium]|nr:ARMT1-like domain-containing protein [Clostridia bacterium]